MGNVAGRRPAVEERLTQPRRLLRQLSDVDTGRLRRLIRSGDLAPCFDAAEDAAAGAGHDEDCPICFYFYPSLNRSKCCGKGICTECFLQLMPSKSSKVVHCPFCKTASYAVEYRGSRTKSEKKLNQQEKQNVSESKKIQSKSQIAGELVQP
ncbi:E3 ubiquitin-protein ligase GW2-like [Oryza brachyantha]|uniref:E3 ubiquitin-protein ligase GW2-like n=1 Tax=Oryza brachyantha TaxID=4533 RepID=UPI001ADAEF6B|nr:E3 ubiquitin-protein ligase GW2-like [Oryza brachyantha]